MQAGRNAMESVKEAVANVGASAKAGMDKTKAAVEEKIEKASAQHPAEKQMAEHKKQLKIHEAEVMKHEAMAHNAAVKEHARSAHNCSSHDPAGTETTIVRSEPVPMPSTARPSAAHGPMVETGYPGADGTRPYSV